MEKHVGFVSALAVPTRTGTLRSVCPRAQRAASPLERSSALVGARSRARAADALKMQASSDAVTKINVTGNNVELTESLRNYVIEKVGKATSKFGAFITKVDVHLSVAHNPSIKNSQTAEVVVFVPGTVLRAEVKLETAYASIDVVTDKISRKLRKYKERNHERRQHSEKTVDVAAMIEGMYEQDAPMTAPVGHREKDLKEDLKAPEEVVKVKSFAMPMQSIEDAALCLEYIDHDFYVFRNAETSEINVLYKRNHGGLGLIKPKMD